MANPLLWLGAILVLTDRNRQFQETKTLSERVTRLEEQVLPQEEQSERAATVSDDASGCAGAFLLFFVAIPAGLALLYGLFLTIPGQIILGIAVVLLLCILVVKKSPWAIVVGILCGSVPIFSAHGMGAVLFFWGVAALIVSVVRKIFGRLW